MQLHCDFACHHVFGENRWRNPQLVGLPSLRSLVLDRPPGMPFRLPSILRIGIGNQKQIRRLGLN